MQGAWHLFIEKITYMYVPATAYSVHLINMYIHVHVGYFTLALAKYMHCHVHCTAVGSVSLREECLLHVFPNQRSVCMQDGYSMLNIQCTQISNKIEY